ncbi:MAG: AAA family ATPase [Aquificaceae bacterium]|nr:AAA family ATPase [Aquificaceae bacterium]
MLLRLSLENFFLIKSQDIYFDNGFNVITGETGTGKSLTVSSLLFLMGQEGEYADGTSVEAELLLDGEQVVVRREFRSGRSRYFLNGRGSTRKVVEEILSSSILLQGQNDRTNITRADFQRDVYDRFANALGLREDVEKVYQEVLELERRLKELKERNIEREVRIRLIQEEIEEVEGVGLKLEEYEDLKKRLEEISLAEKINSMVMGALSGLDEAKIGLSNALKSIRSLSAYKELGEHIQKLELTVDYVLELGRYVEGLYVSYNQQELDFLNEKLYKVQRLERKYGMPYSQIWERAERLKGELTELQEAEDPEKLEKELRSKEEELEKLYQELTQIRLKSVESFENRIKEYLQSMGLERASFKVAFEERRSRYGKEQVRFLFSSYGKDEKDIAQIASGGEISRLSLAIFMLSPPAQTYVLDEVDTGISGATSIKLARLLKRLSKSTQLIVITHSPALASAGDKHLTTRKEFTEDRPVIKVLELRGDERLQEVARLMGSVNDNTLKGANELMKDVCRA